MGKSEKAVNLSHCKPRACKSDTEISLVEEGDGRCNAVEESQSNQPEPIEQLEKIHDEETENISISASQSFGAKIGEFISYATPNAAAKKHADADDTPAECPTDEKKADDAVSIPVESQA